MPALCRKSSVLIALAATVSSTTFSGNVGAGNWGPERRAPEHDVVGNELIGGNHAEAAVQPAERVDGAIAVRVPSIFANRAGALDVHYGAF